MLLNVISPIFDASDFLKRSAFISAILLSVSSAYVPVNEIVRPNLSGSSASEDEGDVKMRMGGVLSIVNAFAVTSDLLSSASVAYAVTLYFPSG